MNTVWIYVDTSKEVGDLDHPKVSPARMLRRLGCRRMIRKASRSSMRLWSEASEPPMH
jgi:hypothetical protein